MQQDAAIQRLANDEHFMRELIGSLHAYEQRHGWPASLARDEATGPMIDHTFMGCSFTRRIASGLEFQFTHRGRITREFILANDDTDHVWEPQTTRLLLHFARQARQVIVAGAYFGDQALPIAKQVQASGGEVHAFEPTSEQHASLLANAQRNHLDNVRAHCMGLWSKSDIALRFIGKDELASPVEASPNEPSAIAVTTVDAYLAKQGIAQLDLLMIDVEGGEFAVLQGAKNQLQSHAPVVVFESNSRYSDWSRGLENAETCVFLRDLGYDLYAIRDHHANMDTRGRPVELIPASRTLIEGPPHGFNMLAVKDSALIAGEPFRLVHDVSPKLLLHKDDSRFHPVD